MDSETKKSTLSGFDKWSQIFMLIGLLATPLLFWPAFGMSLEAIKKLFLAGTVVVALILWFVARLKTKNLTIPRTALWAIAAVLLVVMAVSGLVSGAAWSSFLGLGAETGTVYSMLVFFGLAFLATEYSLSKQKFAKLYVGLFSVFAVAFLFQLSRYLFGNYLPWSIFDQGATNLIGKWNDLGIFAGLVALSTTVMLEFFPLKQAKGLKIFLWSSLVAGLLTLALVNFFQLWGVLAVFSLVIFILGLTVLSHGKKKYLRISSVLFVVSVLFLLFGAPLNYDAQGKAHEGYLAKQSRVISEKLKIASLEVRPSWRGTVMVVSSTWKKDVFFGVGPNHFSNAWLAYKPSGVNDSQFWNIEPEFGVGLLPTFFVTTGLLGGLAILAFVLYLLYVGFKALLNPKIDPLDKSFLLLSFVGAAYGWTLLSMYVPQSPMLAIIFALTGLFIARLVDAGQVRLAVQPLAVNPRTKFISTISSIVVGVIFLLVAYGWVASVGAVTLIQRAGAAMAKNDPDKALTSIKKAIVLNPEDIYYRTAAQVNLNQMAALSAKKLTQEQAMAEYSKY
ncbi:MAG: hypothetical protein NTY66_04080, partial [Candidatus Vogelbacteria bacterium]|nr:hypothetical protein [Candidatus Vogelbacteria bacterium]